MANERMYPILPCQDLDEAVRFYEILGFKRTYRQLKPNPYAVVSLEDLQIHLFGMAGFNPADSYGSVIIAVPDPDGLYQSFAARLREAYGKLPVKGIPRMTRPRKKYGTVSGFSVVDVGGNWLRISKLGATEEGTLEKVDGLAGAINVATRLGDAHGDEALALKTLENGISRFPTAPVLDRVRAYLYQAELAIRITDHTLARESLSRAKALELTDNELSAVAGEFEHVTALIGELGAP